MRNKIIIFSVLFFLVVITLISIYYRNIDKKKLYNLKIKPTDLEILEECRTKALEINLLTDDNQPYVNGILELDTSVYRVKIKLKGTLRSHWADPLRWSFRVIIQDEICHENGMKIFSLQSATQRGEFVDLYYHFFLKSLGLIYMRYNDINFSINNNMLPNYSLEEFFDFQLVLNNKKPNGPILKYVFDDYWENVDWTDPYLTPSTISASYKKAYETTVPKSYKFRSGKYKNWKADSKKAKKLLRDFKKEKLKAHQVFDLDLFGKYFAINTLFGNQHPSFLTNLRFYFNPLTNLIEPIGYDMERINDLSDAKNDGLGENFWPNKTSSFKFIDQLFSDSLMNEKYFIGLKIILENSTEILKEISNSRKKSSKEKDQIEILKTNLKHIELKLIEKY